MKRNRFTALSLSLPVCLLLAACQPASAKPEGNQLASTQGQPSAPAPAGDGVSVTVSLMGTVWNDQCEAAPGTAPDPLPAGCVAGSLGAAQADGLRDPAELPLAGVTVQVGLGNCPATGLGEAITDPTGQFSLSVSAPAASTLCVSVDAGSESNAGLLLAGAWTAPQVVQGALSGIEWTVPAEDGELADLEFGWDYQKVGLSTLFRVAIEANCRSGPGTLYPVLAGLRPQDELPIVGRNQDSSWFMLDLLDGRLCWVSTVTGEAQGNTGGVEIISAAPPPPAVTPQASSGASTPLACSSFTTPETCDPSRCDWFSITGRGNFCVDKP